MEQEVIMGICSTSLYRGIGDVDVIHRTLGAFNKREKMTGVPANIAGEFLFTEVRTHANSVC